MLNGIVESDCITINYGFPQGRVLGPLVFILYINKFGEEIGKNSNVLQFANDTAIFGHEKNEKCLDAEAKKILMEIEQNMKQNKLTLTEGKTEILVFNYENSSTLYFVDFKSLSFIPTQERGYLGVIVISVKGLELSDQFKWYAIKYL